MKLKRKKILLLAALLALVGIVPLFYFGARMMLARRIMGWREEGMRAADAGRHAEAADLLSRYLRRRPEDAEALVRYARSREVVELPNGQHLAETINALRLLIGIDPKNPARLAERHQLLDLYHRLNRRPEALDTADNILAVHPNDARALGTKTKILSDLGQHRDALEAAVKWTQASPTDLAAHVKRIELRAAMGHSGEEIVADAASLREAHPDDARFEILQGAAYALAGDDGNAGKWLKTAAARKGLSDELVKVLVDRFDSIGQSGESLAFLQTSVASGAGTGIREMLACRLWEQSRWPETAAVLAGLDPSGRRVNATLAAFKAMALSRSGKAEEAAACRAALALHDAAAARAWVLLLGRLIDGAAGEDRAIVSACRSALAVEGTNAYIEFYLGEALARLGETDAAIGVWQLAATHNSTWTVPAVRLVESLLQKGRPEQAMRVASVVARRSPNNAAAVVSLARAWAASVESGSFGHAEKLLSLVSEVQQRLPGEERTLLIQLQLMTQMGRRSDAVRAARAALAREPAPGENFILSLVALSRRFGLGIEEECFARSEQAHGITPALAYGRAADRFIAGKADEGLRLFDAMAARSGDAGQVGWRLARVQYLDIIGHPLAAGEWAALGEAHPRDLNVQQAAAAARSVRGDWTFMPKAIERLKAITGEEGLVWRLAEARLLVESARDEQDHERGTLLLNDIIRRQPELAEARVLLARSLVRMKRLDGAIEHLSVASRIEPTSIPIALQLSALLQSRGDFDRVRQELDRVLPQVRSADQRRQAALLLAQQGNHERAIQVLEEQKGQSGQQQDLMLAMLYHRRGETEKAEAVIRKGLERSDLAAIQMAVSFYASLGRRSDAERALALLDGLKLEPGTKELLHGSFHAQVGEYARAVERFRAAVGQTPGNATAWRILAATYFAAGDADSAVGALREGSARVPSDRALASAAAEAPTLRESADDEGLRPVVISFVRSPYRAEAVLELLRTVNEARAGGEMARLANRLQQLADRNPTLLPAHLQLARSYAQIGRMSDAISVANKTLNAFPHEAEPARLLVQLCGMVQPPRWEEMLNAAQAWKARAGADLPAVVATARAQVGLKRHDAAVVELKPHLAAARSDPEANADLLMLYAAALVNSGRGAEAAELLWPLVEQKPAWRARWIQVGLNIPERSPAVAWLERLAAVVPEDAERDRLVIAEAFDRLGRKFNATELVARAASVSDQLASRPEASAMTLLAAAVQAERGADVQKAMGLYRRALEKDPSLWIAQNNLAVLLTRHGAQPAEAVALAERAVRSQPRIATLHDTLASAHAKANNHKAAADAIRTAIKLDPDNVQWRVKLAQCLLDSGEVSESAKALAAIDSDRLGTHNLKPAVQEQLESIRRRMRGRSPGG